MKNKTILIAGGSGMIGTRLAEYFQADGHTVRILSRHPSTANQFAWDPMAGTINEQSVQDVDVVINLAGAGIADRRWTADRKRLIVDSRVKSAQLLLDTFQRIGHMPSVYLSAAAIGYYGNAGEDWVNEYDAPADRSFLVESCLAWEGAAEKIGAAGIRTVVFRIGIVLDQSGGALREIIKPLRFGLGAYFSDGQAWYSWVAIDDVCRMFQWAAEASEIEGVFNAVAPHPARNIFLVKATAHAMEQAAIFVPAPAFALRLLFGEMADTILFSTRASAEKIIEAGFHFQYPELNAALAHIFKKQA